SYLPEPLHGVLPNFLIAALRAVIDGQGCWSVSGNLTSQGLHIHNNLANLWQCVWFTATSAIAFFSAA
ncbi:MAG: hypothetical protein ACKPKO_56970, partial [Candidatus Fonsibacter sp.]